MWQNGGYSITGWKAAGRQSLTQQLKAGQMRGMGKPHIIQAPVNFTQINNYGGCGVDMMIGDCCYHDHDCGGGSNWLQDFIGFLGTACMAAAPWIGGGGGGSRVETGTEKPAEQPADEFAGLKTGYPDGKFFKVGDKYCCNLNGVTYDADSIEGLYEKLKEAGNKGPDGKPTPASDPTQTTLQGSEGGDPAAQPTQTPVQTPVQPETKFKPVLFHSDKRSQEAEEAAFEEITKCKPFKFSDAAAGNGITITAVRDHGNETIKTDKNNNTITLSKEQLKDLADHPGKKIALPNKFSGKSVQVESLNGQYIRVQVGDQTYIVGADMKAHQYKDGQVIGYNEVNWHGPDA